MAPSIPMDGSGIELISVNRSLRRVKISQFVYCRFYVSKGIKLSRSYKISHFMMVPFIPMDGSGIELISVNRSLWQENNNISKFAYCRFYVSKRLQEIKLSHSRKIYHFMMVPFILRYCCGIELISVNRSLRRGKNKISQFAYCRFYVSKGLKKIKLSRSKKISHFMMVRFILRDMVVESN